MYMNLFDALVAHDGGYPLSCYTCGATRVAAHFLDFIAFCRCSTGVALHPLKILVSHLPPPVPGGVAPKFGSEKVSRYRGVSQLQLRVSRYTVQLSLTPRDKCVLVKAPFWRIYLCVKTGMLVVFGTTIEGLLFCTNRQCL